MTETNKFLKYKSQLNPGPATKYFSMACCDPSTHNIASQLIRGCKCYDRNEAEQGLNKLLRNSTLYSISTIKDTLHSEFFRNDILFLGKLWKKVIRIKLDPNIKNKILFEIACLYPTYNNFEPLRYSIKFLSEMEAIIIASNIKRIIMAKPVSEKIFNDIRNAKIYDINSAKMHNMGQQLISAVESIEFERYKFE